MLTAYSDLIEHLLDYAGATPSAEDERYARSAVQTAIATLPQIRQWGYYYSPWLQVTNASQLTGTITYDHTGGANERQVTLTGGTWPDWAADAVLRIVHVDYEVDQRISDTILTLLPTTNPGTDIVDATVYVLYQNAYHLPTDFMAMGPIINQTNQTFLAYIPPSEWQERAVFQYGPALPVCYTIMGSRNSLNTMDLYTYPAPSAAFSLAAIYQRRMRPVLVSNEFTGKITVSSSSTSVVGTGTAFNARMIGSVMRFGSSITDPPTGLGGPDPFECERMVTNVTNASSLTIDMATGIAYTGTKYRISDPVDVREATMGAFLLRECEKQFRIRRRMRATPDELSEYEMARVRACEADAPSFQLQDVYGQQGRWRAWSELPLRYYPMS